MRPDTLALTHGEERQGSFRFSPDIAEQTELARRIESFVRSVGDAAILPTQTNRVLKDYRAPQPNGYARVAAAYSSEKSGKFAAEVRVAHQSPEAVQNWASAYILSADHGQWVRTTSLPQEKGREQVTFLSHDNMLEDMLKYVSKDGAVAALYDGVPTTATGVTQAIFKDMHLGARYKAGNNSFRATLATAQADGYTAARTIELVDGRTNRKIHRSLLVTALTSISVAPVDISQRLAYDVKYQRNGSTIKEDEIRLTHSSSDGLSSDTLAHLAKTSDTGVYRFDILHQALDDLTMQAFFNANAA